MRLLLSILFVVAGYSAKSQEFKINTDTLHTNIKGELGVSLKYKDTFYCFFNTRNPNSTKSFENFYTIAENGSVISNSNVTGELNSYYKDLFIKNGNVVVKTYYDGTTYSWDNRNNKWLETETADDILFEDDNYYVTSLDFGEWGGCTWFKDKKSGLEYQVDITTPEVYKLHNVFYLISGTKIITIRDPRKLQKLEKEYYYNNVREGKSLFKSAAQGSLEGLKVLYHGNDYLFSENKFLISKSFVFNKELFHIVVDNDTSYIAKFKNGNFELIKAIGKNIYVYRPTNSYRNRQLNKVVNFTEEHNNERTVGMLEINGNKISLHYIR